MTCLDLGGINRLLVQSDLLTDHLLVGGSVIGNQIHRHLATGNLSPYLTHRNLVLTGITLCTCISLGESIFAWLIQRGTVPKKHSASNRAWIARTANRPGWLLDHQIDVGIASPSDSNNDVPSL